MTDMRLADERLLNPFTCEVQWELLHQIQAVPFWTEYYYFFGYDLQSQHGATVHIGRASFDSHVWQATMSIYLPEGDLLVAKCSGRDGHARGPGAGPLRITCVEPWRLWTLEFDGVAQPTTRDRLMSGAHQDTPGEPVQLFLRFDAAAPLWRPSGSHDGTSVGLTHHWEQICKVAGTIVYRGRTIAIVGGGVRDHSSGPRDYAPFVGCFFVNALFEDGTAMMAQRVHSVNRTLPWEAGYIFRNGLGPLENVELCAYPAVNSAGTPLNSVARDPLLDESRRHFSFSLRTAFGEELIEGQALHAAADTYVSPSDLVLGTDFSRPTAAQMTPSAVRFRWKGIDGVGNCERIARINTLR